MKPPLVVADSSPIRYLVEIESVSLLPVLFDAVAIPRAVALELSHPSAPPSVRQFIASIPTWMSIIHPRETEKIPEIDPGEEAAIALAREIHADLLLMDDAVGRRDAAERGLRVVGTIGVIERAAIARLIDHDAVLRIDQLSSLPGVLAASRKRVREQSV